MTAGTDEFFIITGKNATDSTDFTDFPKLFFFNLEIRATIALIAQRHNQALQYPRDEHENPWLKEKGSFYANRGRGRGRHLTMKDIITARIRNAFLFDPDSDSDPDAFGLRLRCSALIREIRGVFLDNQIRTSLQACGDGSF
jgi:hypothetical protein